MGIAGGEVAAGDLAVSSPVRWNVVELMMIVCRANR